MNSWTRRLLSRWKPSAIAGLLTVVAGFGASICQAQSVTVIFRVEMPRNEMRKGLKIRAIQKSPGTRSKSQELTARDYDTSRYVYTHNIDRLPPGTYDFVVCDGRDYKPGLQTATVQGGPPFTITFLLEDQNKGDFKIQNVVRGPDNSHVGQGAPVFLKDVATGCILEEKTTDDDGRYEFDGLPPKTRYEISTDEADRDP
jgi:hypothetical protein